MRQRIAITGASGFIGRYLQDALTLDGHDVVIISRATTDYTTSNLTTALSNVDTVIHLAGRRMTREDHPKDLTPFIDPNVLLTGRLMDAATNSNVRRFIFASTIAVYNPLGPKPYDETTLLDPINAYALSKKMAEDYLALKNGPEVIVLRLAAIYGHGEKGTPALMRFIDQANTKRTLTLNGNANYCIDQLYIRDAVSAFIAATLPKASSGIYNIGAGQAFTIRHLAETANRVFENVGNLDTASAQDGPLHQTFMTIVQAKSGLGWAPIYSIENGLADVRKTQETSA